MFDKTKLPVIFDCHIHMPTEEGFCLRWIPKKVTPQDMVDYLDRLGIAGAMLISTPGARPQSHAEIVAGHREIARVIDRYPGRFTGGIVVNPRWPDEALDEITYCRRELNFVWLGECTAYMSNYNYDDAGFAAMVDRAIELGLLIHVHAAAKEIDGMAQRWPAATFVMPHFPDMDGLADLEALLRQRSNVYFDISGNQYVRVGLLEMAVSAAGAERVMFGSDYTICDPATVIARVAYADISEQDKALIFSGTILKLLADRGVTFRF
jgi:predicted TIM-barrel fold metal-dependent hydrolase